MASRFLLGRNFDEPGREARLLPLSLSSSLCVCRLWEKTMRPKNPLNNMWIISVLCQDLLPWDFLMQLVQEIPPKMAEQTNTGMVSRDSYWHSIYCLHPMKHHWRAPRVFLSFFFSFLLNEVAIWSWLGAPGAYIRGRFIRYGKLFIREVCRSL